MFRRFRSGRRRARRDRSARPSLLRYRKPLFEQLEERQLLAVFTVINTNDAGVGSLRQAIIDANAALNMGGVPDEIRFEIPGAGVHTIQPTAELDAITEAVFIDGYSQAGATENTFTGSLNTVLTIELDGQNAGAGADGLQINSGGSGSIIRGLAINRFSDNGIHIDGADNVTVAGNFIGTSVSGLVDLGNGLDGVHIGGDADTNTVGGTMPADRNLISGNNSDGVDIEGATASGNIVRANLIGLDVTGAAPLGNSDAGVEISSGSTNNTIGGTSLISSRNIISGNLDGGVLLIDAGTTGNFVTGNYIGTDHFGTSAVGNVDGVQFRSGAASNTIGGTTSSAANTISGNSDDGVDIDGAGTSNNLIHGNFIGSDFAGTNAVANGGEGVEITGGATNNFVGGTADGAGNTIAFNTRNGVTVEDGASIGNRILRNTIRNNTLLGIDLGDDGVTPNDAGDPDVGPNLLQNFPVFIGNATLLGDSIALRYIVNSAPGANATYPLRVEFFIADSGNQEGRTFLAFDDYVVGEAQTVKMVTIAAPPVLTNTRLVATATDANGNTSEFSDDVTISLPRILGSEPTVILPDEIIGQDQIDFYQYIAHSTGKLVVRIDFFHAFGDLALEVRDEFGNLLASSDTSSIDQNFEEVILPVVTQEKYFVSVIAVDFGIEQQNFYALELENFPTPVPTGVHLDPASDTGMMNNDGVTSDTTPTFFIQTDVLNFVDTNNSGMYEEPDNGGTDAIEVLSAEDVNEILTGVSDDDDDPDDIDNGIAVEITLVNTTDGTTIVTGFADAVIAMFPDVFRFTIPDNTPLTPGVYLVSARTKVWDAQGDENGDPDQAMGRSSASPPLWITISADSPTGGTFDLLASSDTGMFNNDNVTNKMQPAFSGQGPANAKVHVFAQPFDAAGMPVGDPLLVGEGTVGSDATDGIPGNGLGLWEVTVEPMADGKYNFFARFESAAGVLGDPVALGQNFSFAGPVAIPNDGTALESTIMVPEGMATIADLNVTVNITHPIDAELDIFLIAPNGTEIGLSTDNGNGFADYTGTIFDDAAGIAITAGAAPFTGTFRPEENLAQLNGLSIAGTWRLRITDDSPGGGEFPAAGTLLDWSLQFQSPLMVEIDTVEPNTPYLDLLDDTGRHDNDNITKDNTPNVSMTTTDPNFALVQHLFADNFKFRIFDRFENGATEVLIYDSAADAAADAINFAGDMFTAATQLTRTLAALADGVHNLKLEVEDRAGNISDDFLLSITVDTATPPVSFGLPDAASEVDGLAAESDTGVTTMPMTYADRITSDTTPRLWGRAEADTIVRVYLDRDADGVIDLNTDTFLGQTVALPYDGNDAYPDGYWELTTTLDLNEILGLPKDGLRRLLVTAEDVAGNPMPMFDEEENLVIEEGVDELQIFIDTQGPQITNVFTVADELEFDIFDPKPSENGYTPLIFSLSIQFRDLPNRLDQTGTINDFLYEALKQDVATNPGNYLLVGDHVGVIAIASVTIEADAPVDGQPATAAVALNFFEPLPDDRYTLTVSDNLVDPAGNKLDGESNADEPLDDPTFPSGDGVPGGSFIARFTVDSRPEIGSHVATDIDVDINGNFVWDPANGQIGNDATNVDLSFTLPVQNADGSIGLGGYNVHDLLFAGKFRPLDEENGGEGAGGGPIGTPRYFDQLAAYGNSAEEGGIFRWIIDTNSDGVVTLGTDIRTVQPSLGAVFNVAGAIPVAGNFDGNFDNGDEIGLYNAGKWGLDTNHNFVIEAGEVITTALLGAPIVGDFDGDGDDDLAVFNNNQFFFNLANDGFNDANDANFIWGFPGVLDKPVAADMDQDGIDDVGLWVPRDSASLPQGVAEWYFLISNDPDGELRQTGTVNRLNHPFTPTPFGFDIFAEFGDELSLPIVGNFDPPVAASASQPAALAGDYDGNGRVEQADYAMWKSYFGTNDARCDGNGDGIVNAADYSVWRDNLGRVAESGSASAASSGGSSSSSAGSAALTISASEDDGEAPSALLVAAGGSESTAMTGPAAPVSPVSVAESIAVPGSSAPLVLEAAAGPATSSAAPAVEPSLAVMALESATSSGIDLGVSESTVSSAPAVELGDDLLLLAAADDPGAAVDEALDDFDADAAWDDLWDDAPADAETGALALAWQAWDEL